MRSAGWRVARRLSRGMRAVHLSVEAFARRSEAAHGARVGVKRPDRSAQDGEGRRRRQQVKAQVCWIGHLS